jgi:hypothetical protein
MVGRLCFINSGVVEGDTDGKGNESLSFIVWGASRHGTMSILAGLRYRDGFDLDNNTIRIVRGQQCQLVHRI